ncbi:MAG: c-type cytochrome [Marinibacterium sp.]
MDTMTGTKVAAALCGSLLVFLLAKWAAEEIYHVGGHGEASYVIETGGGDDAGAAEDTGPTFEEVLASADVDKGAKVFKKCASCHKIEDGVNATGPSLYGVVGRAVGTEPGFGYSAPMAGHGGDWTPEALNVFLTNPKGEVPGTAMSFAGLKKITDRANVIAYLDSLDD